MRANPDEEPTDWRAVCGRTARTVRREGRTVSFSTPIMSGALYPGVIGPGNRAGHTRIQPKASSRYRE